MNIRGLDPRRGEPFDRQGNGNDPAPARDPELDTLAEALETLPARERDVIVLHYGHGLALREVAARMRLDYGAVRLCYRRALEKLERMLRAEKPAAVRCER